MARDPQLHQSFLQKVKAFYHNLDSQRKHGVKVYTTAYCIAETAKHFDRRPKTIENYIYTS